MTTINDIASKSLGSANSYAVVSDKYDPSLLNPMPRAAARGTYGITGEEFVGVDVWHCHESTFLTNNGLPVAGTLKFIYPSNSVYMIESKSMKLYLNSFDMCKMGDTIDSAITNYEDQVKHDLSSALGVYVDVRFFSSEKYSAISFIDPLEDSVDLYSIIPDLESIEFNDYTGQGAYIKIVDIGEKTHAKVHTNVLRSRCRHTKQKDTGLALIEFASQTSYIDYTSLLKQIVSLREVNEFHEFCAEKLFVEIMKKASDQDNFCVSLLYSRRGSLDINPVRATSYESIPQWARTANCIAQKTQGQ